VGVSEEEARALIALVAVSGIFLVALYLLGRVFGYFRPKRTPSPTEPPPEPQNEPQSAESAAYLAELKETLKDGVVLGNFIEEEPGALPFLIFPQRLRNRHCYIVGKTRTGKTTLAKTMFMQDMEMGHGACYIDPHGDAAEEILACVPSDRIKDVVYFDPSRTYSPSFNFLRLPYPPYKLTEDVVSVFKLFFASAWGPRMEHYLRFFVLTLLSDTEPHTLPDLQTLCLNADYRDELAARMQHPKIRQFWRDDFPQASKDALAPIVNKLSAFLLPGSPLERVFSDPENDLDFTDIMNNKKILIVNLAKGILSDEPSRLLGGLIVSGIQQAALARADMPQEKRNEFYLYIDEFQNFITDSISSILSESAKYKLYLTLAHQTLGQLPKDIERSIFGNVATIICFQISAEDAQTFRREMHRSRIVYREKETAAYRPIGELLEYMRSLIKREEQEHLGFSKDRKHDAVLRERHERIRQDYANLLGKLDASPLSADAVRDVARHKHPLLLDRPLFPDYEIRQLDFPDPDDFINLKARTAFCRMEKAENVTAISTIRPRDPTPGTRGKILNAMRERHAERMKAKPKPTPQAQPPPAQEEPDRKSKARILKTPNVKKPPKPKQKSIGDLSK